MMWEICVQHFAVTIEHRINPAIQNDLHARIVVGSACYLHLVLNCPSSAGKTCTKSELHCL